MSPGGPYINLLKQLVPIEPTVIILYVALCNNNTLKICLTCDVMAIASDTSGEVHY